MALSLPSQSLSVLETPKIQQIDDIDVKIYAGVYSEIEARIGLGWVISIGHNLSGNIHFIINLSWYNLRGQNVRFEMHHFNLSPHPPILFKGVEWIHFPYPIMSLTITVKAVDIIVSRSGIEIGPFVIFEPDYNFYYGT